MSCNVLPVGPPGERNTTMDDQRDYAEESYWRGYCPECDGPCTSLDGHADLDAPDLPPVHGPGSAELFAVSPSSGTPTDHGRVAVLRAEAQQRAARLEAALRSLPPGGTLHA